MIPEIQIEGRRLLAVPAIHHRAVFAEAVNRICRDDATRPAAVAVELGPGAVNAVAAWLREIGVAREPAAPLPLTLGLAGHNRRIHPRYRAAALRLQEARGLPLNEMPVSVLREHLGFAGVSLLCLSATDSIIEAIRSAVELNLPVYGVDIESVANGDRRPGLIEDPIRAWPDLAGYVERNAPLCANGGDRWVDGRREEVMAARLRLLLDRHETVLFTGGIGHWNRLRQRLTDPALKPATSLSGGDAGEYLRVLVDPIMAIHHMDAFPEIAPRYEALRVQPADSRDPAAMYPDLSREKRSVARDLAEPHERDGLPGFIRYLENHGLVSLRETLGFFDLIHAAEAMISRDFAGRLGNELVSKSVSWATPEQWPDLPFLRAEPLTPGESAFADQGRKGRLVTSRSRSKSFYVESAFPEQSRELRANIPSPVPRSGKEREEDGKGCNSWFLWVWPPCEHLLFGTGYQAAGIAAANARGRRSEPFSGSLHDGVDSKATLRAFARGENRVHVRNLSMERSVEADEAGTEPMVYLFGQHSDAANGSWDVLRAGADLSPYISDRRRYQEVVRRDGSVFVASLAFCESRAPEERLRPWVHKVCHLWGVIVFGNPCVNAVQAARWVEECDYSRFPIVQSIREEAVWSLYRERHGIKLDAGDWRSTLIRLAIPYARKRVIVIAPDNFLLSAEIRHEAGARRICIDTFPLSHFSKERVSAIQRQYFVKSRDGLEFAEELEAALGQSHRTHRELLPRRIRAQTGNPD